MADILWEMDADLSGDTQGALEAAAARFGLRKTSGYRSPGHNAAVGGAPNSYHMRGQADDFAGDPVAMRSFHQYVRSGYGDQVAEAIHGSGDHKDHVHVAWNAPQKRSIIDEMDQDLGAPTNPAGVAQQMDGELSGSKATNKGRPGGSVAPTGSLVSSPVSIDHNEFSDTGITRQPQGIVIPKGAFQQTPAQQIANKVANKSSAFAPTPPGEVSKTALGIETAFNEARSERNKSEMERFGRMLQQEGWEAGPGEDGWWYVKRPSGKQRPASQGTEQFVQQVENEAAQKRRGEDQVAYVRSLPGEQRRAAVEDIVKRGEPLSDELRSLAGYDPRARFGQTIVAPLKSLAGRIASGVGAEAETIAPHLGYDENYKSGLSAVGANLQESGRQSAERGAQGPAARFVQGATTTAATLPLGLPAFIVEAYLESRGSGEDHLSAIKHAATTAAGIYAGGKLSKMFEGQVEGAINRYLARSTGLATGLVGASVVSGEPQSLEGLGHTAAMSLAFGIPSHGEALPGESNSLRTSSPEVAQVSEAIQGQVPSELVPEPKGAIRAQLQTLRENLGSRKAVLVPTEDQMPATRNRLENEGFAVTKTPAGIFIHSVDPKNPQSVSRKTVRQMVADGTYYDLLGIVENKSPAATEAVVARDPETGSEVQAAMTSPVNVPAQADELQAQHPNASVGVERPEDVIAGRLASGPQSRIEVLPVDDYWVARDTTNSGFFTTGDTAQEAREQLERHLQIGTEKAASQQSHARTAQIKSPQFAEKADEEVSQSARDYVSKRSVEELQDLVGSEGRAAQEYVSAARDELRSRGAAESPQIAEKQIAAGENAIAGRQQGFVDFARERGLTKNFRKANQEYEAGIQRGEIVRPRKVDESSPQIAEKAEEEPAEEKHHSAFQPRTEEGQFDGPPQYPVESLETAAVQKPTAGKLSVGDVVSHPDFANGEPHKIVSIEGKQLGLRRVDDKGRTLTVDATSRVARRLHPVEDIPASSPVSPKRAETPRVETRQSLYDQLVAARRAHQEKLFQESKLSPEDLDRVAKKFESLKAEAGGRPIKAVVEEYLRQGGLFGSELNDDQKDLLREMASPQRRAPLKAEQGSLFESKPTVESRIADQEARQVPGVTGGLFGPSHRGLFDEPSESASTLEPQKLQAAAPPRVEPAKQPVKEVIQDFGEKIGGARKDTASRTGERSSKAEPESEDPGWRKRFSVSQIVASGNPDEVGKWVISDTRKTDWRGQPRKIGKPFESKEAAEKGVELAAVARNHDVYMGRPDADGNSTYTIWRKVTDRKRVQVVKQEFKSREEAMKYMANHAVDIIETKTNFGEEILAKPDKVVRTGSERRTGPATKEMFGETFGFRGVEFGNWNNQAERQEVMNHAYDGLHDLADVLGVPPKALSLNGELALAFGARGQGLSGAKAHYERDYGVINLTKMSGAGSLAHEWFHAFDHYLGRQDTKANSERVRNERGDLVYPAGSRDRDFASHGFSARESKVREELRSAYKDLVQTMFTKAEKYVEDTQKAEQFVGSSRDALVKKLQEIRDNAYSGLSKQLDSTYRTRNTRPASAEQLEEFDALVKKLIAGEDLNTQWRANNPGKPVMSRGGMSGRFTNDTLDAMNVILKSVRGRSGFNSEGNGTLDYLRGMMKNYQQRIDMLKSANENETKTKQVPTSYAMGAKKIDQGRASDYWTTEHEMAARAFSAYVEDKAAESGNRSDFLSFGSDNKFYRMFDDVRPFPEGAEREAINKSFDNLFDVIESKETPTGTALYQADQSADSRVVSAIIEHLANEGITDFKQAVARFRDEFGPAAEYGDIFEDAWDANKSVKKRGKATFDDVFETPTVPEKKRQSLTDAVIANGRIRSTGFSGKGEKKMLSIKEGGRLGLFSDKGLPVEDMMRTLQAEGWDFDGDLNAFIEALRDETYGNKHYSNAGAVEAGEDEVERHWERMRREEFAKNSDHSIMARAVDNPDDAEYKDWNEAFNDALNPRLEPTSEDIDFFKEVSRDLGISDATINRLIGSANDARRAEAARVASDTESARRGATVPTDPDSFRQGLIDNFDYSEEAADATTSVADALITTLSKESGRSRKSLYDQLLLARGRGKNGLDQTVHGMTEFLKTGQAIIRALKNPNESTAAHEIHHALLPHFMEIAAEPGISDQLARDMAQMSRWMGFKDVADFNALHEQYVAATLKDRELKRYVEGQEKGARGFERYLRTGKAPTPALEAAFSNFKEWLTNIYRNLKGSPIDINISHQQWATWDRMLGGTGELARGGTQGKQETIQTERAQRGLREIEKEGARRWGTVWEEAKEDVDTEGGRTAIRKLAEELAAKPRVLSDEEQARLIIDRARLKASYDAEEKKGLKAMEEDDRAGMLDADAQLAYIQDKLLDNDMALFKAGTEWGRAGAIRQLLAREDYSYERQVNRAKIKKGEDLTSEEKARFKELSEKYEGLQKEIADRNAELESQRAYMTELQRQVVQRERVEGWRASTRSGKARPREQVDAEFASMQNQLARFAREANGLHQADDISEERFPPEVRKLIKDMARNRVEAGARTAEDVNAEVHGIVRQYFPDVTPRQVGEIWSEYGRKSQLSKEQLDVALREAKRQQRLLSALEDAQQGEAPLRSGLQRDKQSQRVRELTRQVMDEIRKQGLQTQVDPEQQWKTSQEALKTRLRNAVEDLDKQIGTGEAPEPRKVLKRAYDDETIALMAERDLLKRQLNDPAARNKQNLTRQLRETERKLREGDLSSAQKQSFPHEIYDDAEASRMRARVKGLQKELNARRNEPRQQERLREGIIDLQRRIRERDFTRVERETREAGPVTEALRAQRDTLSKILRGIEGPRKVSDEARISSAEKALEKSIADLDQRVREGKLAAKQQRMSSPWSAKLGELQTQRAGLAGILKDMRDAAKPARDPQAAALKAFKTRTEKTIADYDRRLREGDFAPRTVVRPKRAYDSESEKLRSALAQVKENFEREQRKFELANRTLPQRLADSTVKWSRGIVLSSAQTIGKLGSAVLQRYIMNPIDNLAGEFWHHMPIVRRISEQAPSEGGGFNPHAEWAALMTVANRSLYGPAEKVTTEAIKKLKTGKGSIDVMYGGKKVALDPEFVDYIAHAHGFMKTPAQVAGFNRAFVKNMEFEYKRAIKHGATPDEASALVAEPAMQLVIGMRAAESAYRDILMQDHVLVSGYRQMLRYLENIKGNASVPGKVLSTLAQIEMPVVKVPANYVTETANYLLGLPTGLIRAGYSAARGQLETMEPERADAIIRQLKKGTVGAGLLTLGWLSPQTFGGYYQPGKRDEDDAPWGGIRIGDHNIPTWLLHSPAMNVLQFGATMRRIYDKLREKGDSVPSALVESAGKSGLGLLEEVPFLEWPVRTVEKLKEEHGAQKFIGEHVKRIVPPDLERAAKAFDPAEEGGAVQGAKRFVGLEPGKVKRDPASMLQRIVPYAAVPGLREMVPEDRAAARSQAIRDLTRRMRGGEDVASEIRARIESGQLNRGDDKSILEDSRTSPFLIRFRGLDVGEAWKVYKAATPAEKKELAPALRRKVAAVMKSNPSLVPEELRLRR